MQNGKPSFLVDLAESGHSTAMTAFAIRYCYKNESRHVRLYIIVANFISVLQTEQPCHGGLKSRACDYKVAR